MASKDLKKLLKELDKQGFRVEERKKGYLAYPPDTQFPPVTIHRTPSDYRSWANQMATLRRYGFRQ